MRGLHRFRSPAHLRNTQQPPHFWQWQRENLELTGTWDRFGTTQGLRLASGANDHPPLLLTGLPGERPVGGLRKLGYWRQLINYLHGFHRDADELLDEVDYIAWVLRVLVGVVDDAGRLVDLYLVNDRSPIPAGFYRCRCSAEQLRGCP